MLVHVYILWSESTQRYYIGVSQDVSRRLSEHNQKKSRYTQNGAPWKLVWQTQKPNRSEALILERKLKNLKSAKRIAEFIEKYS